jgi:hypothetical protein
MKDTSLPVNVYETAFGISSTTCALKKYCKYMLFVQCCIACYFITHYSAITCMVASTVLPMTVCWSEPGWDIWIIFWVELNFLGDASVSIVSVINSIQAVICSKSKYVITFSHFRNQGSPVEMILYTDMPFSTPCFHLTSFLLWHRKFCSLETQY